MIKEGWSWEFDVRECDVIDEEAAIAEINAQYLPYINKNLELVYDKTEQAYVDEDDNVHRKCIKYTLRLVSKETDK